MITPSMMLGLSLGLFVALWACYELGRWYGQRQLKRDPEATRTGTNVIEAGVFGMLGLLLAFAFSGAASRLEARRLLIIQEANSIGTAWLRLDLLPSQQQPALREKFRQYLDARIGSYEKIPDLPAAMAELDRAARLQNDIWIDIQKAVRASTDPQTAMLVFPPINDMFDLSTTRTNSMLVHTPSIIIILLICSALLGSILAAYSGADKPRRKLHVVVFNIMIVITIYVILDLDYPRIGFVREDSGDKVMIDLRKSMD